jgi:monoamine oxidase
VRVCVVGAGYAGLAAADALAVAGADVVVLEAAERLGGRVWSEPFADGVVERGGEFVTSGYDAMAELVTRCGLELEGMGITYPDRELAPDPGLAREEVEAAAAAVARRADELPDAPAPEVLEGAVADPRIRELFASRVQSAVAYPFERLRGRWLTKVTSLIERGETRRIRGGNQRLAEALAAGLPRSPALGASVRAVRANGEGVRAVIVGDEVAADACVVAVPSSLIGEIEFDPPLPADLATELSAIPMSTAAKLAVELPEQVPARALMSVPHRFWAWTTPADRVLGSWAGAGPVVAELGSTDDWLARLGELWPELPLDGAATLRTVWDADSWSRGAYSVLRNAGEGPRQAGSPTVVLAGEYTAAEWSGTMEGALRSGRGAAADVLAQVR